MKKIIFSIFSVFFTLTCLAQQQGQDTVYLKSGSRYIGKLRILPTAEKVELKTADNEIHYFLMNDVFKISKYQAWTFINDDPIDDIYPAKMDKGQVQKRAETTDNLLPAKTLDKSYLILEGSYGFGLNSKSFHVLRFDLIGSYNISKNFNFGVGTGYRNYVSGNKYVTDNIYVSEIASEKVIPVYADLRYLIPSHKYYNFLALDLGYSADVTSSFSPLGYYVNPSFNMAFKIENSFFFFLGIGYEIQNVSYLSENYNNLYLTIGLML